jgi:hypothetical protein
LFFGGITVLVEEEDGATYLNEEGDYIAIPVRGLEK